MLRTISIISRMSLCRMSPKLHSRVISPACINSVRFKYQNSGGGGGDKTGRRKDLSKRPTATNDDESDAGDSSDNAGVDNNLLDDK